MTAFRWTEGSGLIHAGIIVSGDEPGAARPWHVHHNTCAAGGGVVGQDGNYPRLTIGEDGTDFEVTDVPANVDNTADFHVNIHLSAVALDVIIACADMSLLASDGPAGITPPNIPGYFPRDPS